MWQIWAIPRCLFSFAWAITELKTEKHRESIDHTDCEQEPITIPGSIQPHGVLLVLRGTGLTVVQASANLALFLGVAPSAVLGQPVGWWFDEASANRLDAVAQRDDPGRANPLLLVGRFTPDERFDGILHRCGADLILELERVQPGVALTSVRGALPKLQEALTETEVCWMAAKETRQLTGFDRVMVYRFAPDWSGEVVAEDREDGVDSYLGTHFPASDIPKQARELYTRKLLGLIPDVAYSPVPLLVLEQGPPLDMSQRAAQRVADPSRIPSEHGCGGNADHFAGDQR
jgi:two-component system, chemotaxis family, sensor kinase Cph1